MGTRRVVTGIVNGKSVIVSDEVIEPVQISTGITRLWGEDAPPSFPHDGSHTMPQLLNPTAGGFRFLLVTIPPDAEAAVTEFKMPSPEEMARVGDVATGAIMKEGDPPGMHYTDSVDLEVVLSGEASQEFDDGVVLHLKAGDCFVQNGTRHRWFNRGSVPAVVAMVLIGGHKRA